MKKNFKLFIVVALIFAVCLLPNALTAAAAEIIISWGVVPNTLEKTPEPPKGGQKLLEENNGIFVRRTEEKKVYFTFDLGYEAGYTGQVLDILRENNIKAIFFLCGNYLKQKDLINRMINEGHSIGNHTDKHKDLPTLADEGIKKDIKTFSDNFSGLYTAPLNFFRPPQGRFSERVLKIADTEGLKTTLWSIAIVDWGKDPINALENAKKIESRLHPGAVILFHITNSGTPKMLELLIPKIKNKGYQAGTPNEL